MPSPDLTIHLLCESHFGLDGGAMFGIIPRPIWERTNPPDEANRIDMAARNLLIRTSDRNILVDTGMGTNWSEKEASIYNLQRQDPALIQQLDRLLLDPTDITDVILTHLHFDHAGGLLTNSPDGLSPAFPNATHWVQRRNWAWAHHPSDRDQGSYRPDDFTFFENANAPELRLIDGIDEIIPGIEVLPVYGHTFGMQLVKITTSTLTYVFVADLIPTSSHLRAPYVMGYDIQPLTTVEEKRALLYHATRNDWILLFSHDPIHGAGRVELDRRERPTFLALDGPTDHLIL